MNHDDLAVFTQGMTTSAWSRIPVELVDVGIVRLIQEHILIEGLYRAARGITHGDPFPHVVMINGEMWVEDGHCRILVWHIRGGTLMPMRVLRPPTTSST